MPNRFGTNLMGGTTTGGRSGQKVGHLVFKCMFICSSNVNLHLSITWVQYLGILLGYSTWVITYKLRRYIPWVIILFHTEISTKIAKSIKEIKVKLTRGFLLVILFYYLPR